MSEKRFHDAIKELITINKENRARFEAKELGLSIDYYAMEHCTIHVDIGRRSGKSSFIANNEGSNDLIIVFRARLKIEFYRGFDNVKTPDEVMKMENPKYENIYIDEPALVFAEVSVEDIYEKLATDSKEQTFILLGR